MYKYIKIRSVLLGINGLISSIVSRHYTAEKSSINVKMFHLMQQTQSVNLLACVFKKEKILC